MAKCRAAIAARWYSTDTGNEPVIPCPEGLKEEFNHRKRKAEKYFKPRR